MDRIRPFPIQDAEQGYALSLGNAINNNYLMGGKGVKVTRHGGATSINMVTPRIADNMNYRGTYDPTQAYAVNDVVFVDPNVSYPWPFTQPSGSSTASLCGGTFIAILSVPASGTDSNLFLTNVVPAYPVSPDDNVANAYQWLNYNIYYPVYPTIPTSSITTVADGSGFNIVANLTFWMPLAPMYVGLSCDINGNNQTSFTMGVISGSTFNEAALPYPY